MQKQAERHHPKLPAGFGTVRYLGEGRSRPYAVHPSARGGAARPKAICYVEDWYTGVAVLAALRAGSYRPELVADIRAEVAQSRRNGDEALDGFCRRVLGYLSPSGAAPAPHTLEEVFASWYAYKFGPTAGRKLSASAGQHARGAFEKLRPVAGRPMDSLTVDELQRLVDGIGLKRSSISAVILLLKGVYRYALSRELCTKDPAKYLCMPDVPASAHHQDFTDGELAILWQHRQDPLVRMILIMCYSGFRYKAYETLETDLERGYFRGGVKTAASRGRVVPIHSGIWPLVQETLAEDGRYLCGLSQFSFIRRMAQRMRELGIDGDERHHTPHSCRHTFSRLCESAGVREADRKRMLGHSFGSDITNGVYGHRTLEELRREIEKIRLP